MPDERWVVNASPLILLGKLRRLDIVEALASSVAVPESVLREVSAGLRKDETDRAPGVASETDKIHRLVLIRGTAFILPKG